VSTLNEAQEIDYAYHANRLLLLIARRGKLPAGSDQIPAVDAELIAIEALVKSYQLVRAGSPKASEQNRTDPRLP
jgi:hypothetical protein